jgi:DNA-binding XRE family transcriptional regulator
MGKPQVIFDNQGNPAFAVLPWDDYRRLAPEEAEAMLGDEALYDLAKAEADETFPAEIADRLLAGANPTKVFREYRGLTQAELAARAGVNAVYLSQIETGRRRGSTKTLEAIAQVLGVQVDDLL